MICASGCSKVDKQKLVWYNGSNMEKGDRVRDKYTGETGTVLDVWDGKYRADYYEGEQFNPYRITVRFDNSTDGLLGDGTELRKAEHLEPE